MPGLGVRLFTDEHIYAGLARALRSRGYDAESCQEAGRAGSGLTDEAHLTYAASVGRTILTHDRGDFLRLDAEWKIVGRAHPGIILASSIRAFGELLRRVQRHLDTYAPEVQHNTLLWLDARPTR